MSALARLTTRRPWQIMLIVLGLTAVGFGLSGVVSVRLSNGLSDYDDPASASAQARADVQRATGLDLEEGYTLLVRTPAPVSLSAPPPQRVARAIALLRQRPEVVRTADAWSTQVPTMISRDGRSTLVVAQLRELDEKSAVRALQASIDGDPALHEQVLLGGPTAIDVQGSDVSTSDLSFAETLALPILVMLLLVIFRGVVAALLPLLGAAVSIALTTIGLLAAVSATKVSVYSLNLVYALGIGLSIDFSLLIVSRYREEMGRYGPGSAALRRTLVTAGRTVMFSAATVTAALGALLLFPIPAIYSMGLAGMMVTLSSASAALVLLPAVLVLLGRRVDALAPKRWGRLSQSAGADTGRWSRLAHAVMRHPIRVASIVGVALLATGAPVLGIHFTGYDTTGLPSSIAAVQVDTALRTDFVGVTVAPLQLIVDSGHSDAAAVSTYAADVARVRGVLAVSRPAPINSHLWEVDATLQDSALSPDAQGAVAAVRQVATPLDVRASGFTAEFLDHQASLEAHLPLAISLLIVTTLLILFAMTGSVVLPVKTLLMNMLTLAATFGILVVVFQHGFLSGLLGFHSQGAVDSFTPLIAGALAFGLSTDYGVFLLSRIREGHLAGLPTNEAVALGLQRVGRVVTSAAALFCIAIGALVLSQTTLLKELGLGAAIAVLIDATIVRALLVPALMALLGRWNWWAPRPLRALHRWLGLERLDGGEEPSAHAA